MHLPKRYEAEHLKSMRARRARAAGAQVRKEFDNRIDETNNYMMGEQYPDESEGEGAGQGRRDDRSYYLVVNLVIDVVDRLAAILGIGMLETHMRTRDTSDQRLAEAKKDQFDMLKSTSDMSGVIVDLARNVAAYGFGGVRGYVDPFDMPAMGGRIGFEVVDPAQILIDPYAGDPRDPLMGSSYAFYETLTPRWELAARYKEFAKKIGAIGSRPVGRNNDVESFDTLRNFDAAFEGDSGEGSLRGEGEHWSSVGGVNTIMGAGSDEHIRQTEYNWKTIQTVIFNGVEMERNIWWRSIIAGDLDSDDGGLVLDLTPNLYGRPNLVLCQGWTRSDSPYSSGLLDRMGELQNIFNSVMSATIKLLHQYAKTQGVFVTGEESLTETTLNQFLSEDVPDIIRLRQEAIDAAGGDVSNVFKMLQGQDTDFGKKLSILQFILTQIQNVTGVQSSVKGDLQAGDRTSSLALKTAQESVIAAQETIRRHIARFVTNLGYLGVSMMDHHWTNEHQIMGDGPQNGQLVNIVRPFTSERLDAVVNARETGEPMVVGGKIMIPTTLHVMTMEGEEEVVALDEIDSIDSLTRRDDVASISIGFNYMPHIDTQIELVLNTGYKQEQAEIRDSMVLSERTKPGTWSWEQWIKEFGKDIPGFDYEEALKSRLGDQLAQTILQLRAAGRQQEALDLLEPLIQQPEMGQGSSPGAGGQLGVPVAPQPGQTAA